MAEPASNLSLWQDFIATATDPAHILSELVFSVVFELIQFAFIVILWKQYIKPRLDQRKCDPHCDENTV